MESGKEIEEALRTRKKKVREKRTLTPSVFNKTTLAVFILYRKGWRVRAEGLEGEI